MIKKIAFVFGILFTVSNVSGMSKPEFGSDKRELFQLAKAVAQVKEDIQNQLKSEDCADRERVILIGATGSGKTTLLHALAGANLLVEQKKFQTVLTSDGKSFDGRDINPAARIGHTGDSETDIPVFWNDPINKIMYCDTPGLGDNRNYQQRIINAFSVDQLFSEPSAIKIFLVISEDEFKSERGESAKTTFNRISDRLGDIEQLKRSVGLVITKIRMTPPEELLGYLLSSEVYVNPLVKFFLDNPERIFLFPQQPLEKDVKTARYVCIV